MYIYKPGDLSGSGKKRGKRKEAQLGGDNVEGETSGGTLALRFFIDGKRKRSKVDVNDGES